jgi:hypothetical protein
MEVALYIYTKQTIDESIDLILNKFKDRVIADSGTFEADNCLKNQIIALGGVYGVALNTITDFANRVVTDGGTFEAENCLLNIINSLGGVAPTATEIDVVRRIELFNDEKISITSSIQNVNDISKVFTDYSQSFTIPASDNNNEIFRHWYNNDLDNGFNQNFRYSGYIEIDTQVFRTGKWQLESAGVNSNRVEDYKITFYGNLLSLTDKFKEDKLKDIEELNDYNFQYSGNEVGFRIQYSTPFDVLMPLISSNRTWQYGGGGANDISNTATPIVFNELFPALRLSKIFEAIESKYGVNFNGNFLTQSRFTEAYMWLKNKETFNSMSQNVLVDFTQSTGGFALPPNYAGLSFLPDEFRIRTTSIDGEVIMAGTVLWSYNFTFSTPVTWKITLLKDNQPYTVLSGVGSATGDIQLPTIEGVYKMYISTSVSCNFSATITGYTKKYVAALNSYTFYTPYGTKSGSTTSFLNIPSYMPDMKVTDFFSGILKMFNLTAFSYDEENYTLEQLENWYYQGNIKDFSEYCITDFDYERIKPYKKVNFQYEKSESLLNRAYYDNNGEEYGDLSYTFNSDGSDYNIKLPFENIMFNKFTGNNLQVGYAINKDLQPYTPKPLIIYRLKHQTGVNFKFNNGAATNTLTNYNVFGQDVNYQNERHSLNWGSDLSSFYLEPVNNGLFKDYYFDYLNNLYSLKSRMVKVTMRLPYSELLGLRLNDRIVIRDKRYIINSFTTDLDTFESKFELIQDFRNINFNNSVPRIATNEAQLLKFDTTSNEPLTWSILNDPDGQIINITNGADYVEVDIKANTSGVEKIYSIESNNNDLIVITQDA